MMSRTSCAPTDLMTSRPRLALKYGQTTQTAPPMRLTTAAARNGPSVAACEGLMSVPEDRAREPLDAVPKRCSVFHAAAREQLVLERQGPEDALHGEAHVDAEEVEPASHTD